MANTILCLLALLAFTQPVFSQELGSAEDAAAAADSQENALQASLSEGTTNMSKPVSTPATPAKVAPLFEASCKIKAKEAAVSIFRSCMTDGKNAQLEQIRKEYQEKLGAMRTEYEKELSRLSQLKKQKESESSLKTEKSDKAETKPAVVKTSKTKAAAPAVKKQAAQKFTKKGLPIKTVKSVLTEMNNSKSEDSTMTISLKPAKSMEFEESQEIPEPIAIEKVESKVDGGSASIQLD